MGRKLMLKPLIDHAIGSLAEHGNDVINWRKQLHRIKNKRDWTDEDLEHLFKSLTTMARSCNETLAKWEDTVGIHIPVDKEDDDG